MAKRKKKKGGGAPREKAAAKPAAKSADRSEGAGKGGGSRAPVLKRRKGPNWPLLALAAAGMALTGYLSLTAWLGTSPAYCAEGSACDIVQNSRWGTLLGLPTAFWGFLAYTALGYVAWRVRDPMRHWQLAWGLALLGLAFSVYLTVISVVVIQATCTYCLASLALLAAIFAVVAFQRPQGLPDFSWPVWAGQTGLVALVLVGALHLHYSGLFSPAAGPEDPYLKGLAQHLTETGAVFYGAYW